MEFFITYRIYVILICYTPLVGIFLPKTNFGAGIPDFDAVRLFSFLLLLSFIGESAAHRKIKLTNLWILILLFFSVFVFISVSWSQENYSIQFFQEYFDWIFIRLIIAIVGINVFQHLDNIEKFFKHLAASAAIMSVIGITQFALGLTEATGTVRAHGSFGGPNGFAVFLVLTIPSIVFAIQSKVMSKKFSLTALCCVIAGVLSTVSRKGFVAMLASFFIYMFIQKQFKKLFLFISLSIICGAVLFSIQFMQQRFERFQRLEIEREVAGRLELAYAGVKMFLDNPIIGLGYKGYHNNFGRYFSGAGKKNYDAHNEFVTALANYGILGFVLFCLIFIYPVLYSWRVIYRHKIGFQSLVEKNLASICVATTIPLMMSLFFAGAMFYINQYVGSLYYTIVAFAFYKEPITTETRNRPGIDDIL